MNYIIPILIIIIILQLFILLNKTQENFTGLHIQNPIVRFLRRCSDYINNLNKGNYVKLSSILPKKHGELCKSNYNCHSKCYCNTKKSRNFINNPIKSIKPTGLCTCIRNF